jgi:hypothetical protein
MINLDLPELLRKCQFYGFQDPSVAGGQLVVQQEELRTFYPDQVQKKYGQQQQAAIAKEEIDKVQEKTVHFFICLFLIRGKLRLGIKDALGIKGTVKIYFIVYFLF